MNKSYRLLWSDITRTFMAVSEVAKARGKRASAGIFEGIVKPGHYIAALCPYPIRQTNSVPILFPIPHRPTKILIEPAAGGDRKDPHAPGLACESPAALPGAAAASLSGGLTIKAATVLPLGRQTRAACARVSRSEGVEIGLDGPTQRPTNPRERGVFTKYRAICRFPAWQFSRA